MNSSKKIKIPCLLLGIAFLFIFIREKYPQRIFNRLTGQTPLNVPETNYWLSEDDVLRSLPVDTSSIVFIGTSLTDLFHFQEYFPNKKIKNRGIIGDRCAGIFARVNEVIQFHPKKIFLEMGINDVLARVNKDTLLQYFVTISQNVKATSPQTKFYIQSLLPVYEGKYKGIIQAKKANEDIIYLNQKLKEYCLQNKITFISLYDKFVTNGELDPAYSEDGVHLLGKGYDLWAKELPSYINE
jgi:lysophospholipase L1-like esterase